MADDGEVGLVAAEIDGGSPEIDDVQQGDQGKDTGVQQVDAQGASLAKPNAECRMQNAECRMQNAECRMPNYFCILHFAFCISFSCVDSPYPPA
jgi:hypothetical protein